VQGLGQGLIDLQQGLAAGQHHIAVALPCGPLGRDQGGQGLGVGKLAAQGAIGAHKVGIAKPAHGRGPVGFAPAPQVAAGKAAEHRGPAGAQALALQGVENFFDGIAHAAPSARRRSGGCRSEQAAEEGRRKTTGSRTACGDEVLNMVFLYMAPGVNDMNLGRGGKRMNFS